MPRLSPLATAALAWCVAAAPAAADLIQAGDGTVSGRLCVGVNCANDELFASSFLGALKLKGANTRILFEDTSLTGDTDNPFTDWALQANGITGSADNRFLLRNETAGTTPFSVQAGAADNSLYVAANGDVGLGTMLPQVPLQVETSTNNGIRLNRANAGSGGQAWETVIFVNGDFGLSDITNGTTPFAMRPGTPNNAIFLEDDTAQINSGRRDYNFEVRWDEGTSFWADGGTGDIGIGIQAPAAPLHIFRDNSTAPGTAPAGLLVEDASTLTATRGLLTLRNNGRAFFALEDTSIADTPGSGRQWNFQNRDGEFAVTTSPGGTSNIEMRLDSAGNMRIKGNFFAQNVGNDGTQIAVPDYVFAPDYALKPLSEVAAFIAEHSHLPDVPSAAEITETGLNMTEMQMTLLKKIEELTLYTLEQDAALAAEQARNAQQEAELVKLRALAARVDQIEATLVAQ